MYRRRPRLGLGIGPNVTLGSLGALPLHAPGCFCPGGVRRAGQPWFIRRGGAALPRLGLGGAPGRGGYVSDFTMVTGQPYTDPVLTTCSQSRGRQNEPAVAVDPRNPRVVVGSSNDYCGVFQSNGSLLGLGNVWLGYYRSEDGGASFVSSLVPGYVGDTSPYAANAHIRTADSGDPVLAWDSHGRVFAGSESSGDRAGTAKTFGAVWVATYP